jgi:serine/threonine protein kinase
MSVKLLNQGAYGCVFRPGYNKKKEAMTQQYVSKIQLENEFNETENKLGKEIMTIKQYWQYFAPIIDHYPLFLHSNKDKEVKKCHLIEKHQQKHPGNKQNKYLVNKIKYVGKNDFGDYFAKNTNQATYMRSILQSHAHLLKGLLLLKQRELIHYDLSSRNIVFSDNTKLPIIIDFGLSYKAPEKGVDLTREKSPFYVYGPEYEPWCLDIHIISYFVQEKAASQTFTKTLAAIFINDLLKQNYVFSTLLTDEERNKYTKQWLEYLSKWYDRPTKELIDELYKYRFTWDNYAIAMLYMDLLVNTELAKQPEFGQYIAILKAIILSTGETRPSIEDVSQVIYKIVINNNKYKLVVKELEGKTNIIRKKIRASVERVSQSQPKVNK